MFEVLLSTNHDSVIILSVVFACPGDAEECKPTWIVVFPTAHTFEELEKRLACIDQKEAFLQRIY